jgi:predicted dehydrogenase
VTPTCHAGFLILELVGTFRFAQSMKLIALLLASSAAFHASAAELRLGMIGLDTSHVIAFTSLLNKTNSKDHVPGAKVVAAFKGGSPDVESSRTRVDGYTKQLQDQFGVKIVESIEELCRQVDAVLLESVDGRPHLEQARPVIRARKPLFIDKPVAGSLRGAIEIYRLAKENNVPVFSSSSYRFYDSVVELKRAPVGEIRNVISWGPAHLESHHPDMFWYGVHPTEALFTIMGTGCETVVRSHSKDSDVITGTWSGGRIGTLVGLRTGATPSKVMVFGSKAAAEQKPGSGGYAPLVREIIKFFQTGVAPVPPEETIEMFAFMEAADESKRQGGKPVSITEVMARHRRSP